MRPLGVRLIGVYQVLRGVLGAILGLSIMASAGYAAKAAVLAAESNAIEGRLRGAGHIAELVIIVFALLNLAAGYGILQMQNWGRLLTVLLAAVGLVLVLGALSAASIAFGLLNAATIVYLATPPIRRAFHAAGNPLRMAA